MVLCSLRWCALLLLLLLLLVVVGFVVVDCVEGLAGVFRLPVGDGGAVCVLVRMISYLHSLAPQTN